MNFAISKRCNKEERELLFVQFYSEIILVISNHGYAYGPNCTPLSSVTIINHCILQFIFYTDYSS